MASSKKCPWTPEEDMKLMSYISKYGIWNWTQMPKHAGLSRTGKSCRLRWLNYLNPEIKRGNYTAEEDDTIINMRVNMGAGWSAIAARLPGRTDNEIKNRWHTHLKKRFSNNSVDTIEPKEEEIMELDTDTINDTDYSSSSTTPETQLEEFHEYNSMLADMLNSSNNIVSPPTQTCTDPHISCSRQPFPSENVNEDKRPTYIDPESELQMAQRDWFKEPFSPCDCCNNYWFNLWTIRTSEDHQCWSQQ